jgi:hypothetical protein
MIGIQYVYVAYAVTLSQKPINVGILYDSTSISFIIVNIIQKGLM